VQGCIRKVVFDILWYNDNLAGENVTIAIEQKDQCRMNEGEMPHINLDSIIERGAQAVTNGGVLKVRRSEAGRNTHLRGYPETI
jgi:hypothetical protein